MTREKEENGIELEEEQELGDFRIARNVSMCFGVILCWKIFCFIPQPTRTLFFSPSKTNTKETEYGVCVSIRMCVRLATNGVMKMPSSKKHLMQETYENSMKWQ